MLKPYCSLQDVTNHTVKEDVTLVEKGMISVDSPLSYMGAMARANIW